MAEFRLESDADRLTEQLAEASRVILQLEPVNRATGQLFHSAEPGRTVTADATANGVVVAARWRHRNVVVARPWFVHQLLDAQPTIVDLYTQHATSVVANIG